MRRSAIALCALIVLTVVAPARADYKRIDDRADTRGRLDIKWVRQAHDYNAKIRYSVSTFENYSSTDLRHGRFVFRFDVDPDDGFERFVTVHWRDFEKADGGKLASPVKNARRDIVGRAGIAHWSGNRLRIWLARRHLKHPTRYTMEVSTEWRRGPCERHTCVDDTDGFSHRLWPLCFGQDPRIVGTEGADVLEGTNGSDIIYGGGGNDRIETRGGWDYACGGPGDDHIVGTRTPDQMSGGIGDDRLVGRGATYRCNDTADVSGDCAFPYNGMHGGAGGDEIVGGPHSDWIWAGPGDDLLYGRDGRDRLGGGPGYDVLDGGRSEDECRTGEVKQRC